MISLLFLGLFLRLGGASPISGGKDVGKVEKYFNKLVVVNPGTFAYVVDLEITIPYKVKEKTLYDDRRCGGVIIRSDVILTAAHCIGANVKYAQIVAWAGIVDIEKQKYEGQRIKVKQFKVHEKFGLTSRIKAPIFGDYDIALLWLKSAFMSSAFIKIAKLPKKQFDPKSKDGSIVGWGLTACGETPSMLQKATVKVLSQSDCQQYYKKSKISKKVICAASDDRKSANNFGDSGGPLVVDDTVVGISSFGELTYVNGTDGHKIEVCNPKIPGVYTDVSKYINWIDKSISSMRRSP